MRLQQKLKRTQEQARRQQRQTQPWQEDGTIQGTTKQAGARQPAIRDNHRVGMTLVGDTSGREEAISGVGLQTQGGGPNRREIESARQAKHE